MDRGPGIPESSVPRLFDLFYRDPSIARTASGSGIGLYVCRSLVEAMGGRIDVVRDIGGGAAFTFSLPILDSDIDEERA